MDHDFSASVYGLSAMHECHELNEETLGAVTYNTDRENKVRLVRCYYFSWKLKYRKPESAPQSLVA